MDDQYAAGNVLGNTASVSFPLFNVEVNGKVDTGATTTSLHATNIKVNHDRRSVSFTSEVLSDKIITLKLASTQDVVSADGGDQERPVVNFDLSINGVHLKGMEVNLNDRDHMDTKLLIGQNVLKAGQFQVDVSKDEEVADDAGAADDARLPAEPRGVREHEAVVQAIDVLRREKVTLEEIFQYLTMEALSKVEKLES